MATHHNLSRQGSINGTGLPAWIVLGGVNAGLVYTTGGNIVTTAAGSSDTRAVTAANLPFGTLPRFSNTNEVTVGNNVSVNGSLLGGSVSLHALTGADTTSDASETIVDNAVKTSVGTSGTSASASGNTVKVGNDSSVNNGVLVVMPTSHQTLMMCLLAIR